MKSEQEVIALRFDLTVCQASARCDDASKGAFNELSRLCSFDLITDRNLDALIE